MSAASDEVMKAISEYGLARDLLLERFVDLARNLEPQLRDLNAQHTADRLLSLLVEFDAAVGNFQAVTQKYPAEFALLLMLGRVPKK